MVQAMLRDGVTQDDVFDFIREAVANAQDRPRSEEQARRAAVRAVSAKIDEWLVWPDTPAGRLAEQADGHIAHGIASFLAGFLIDLASSGAKKKPTKQITRNTAKKPAPKASSESTVED